MLAQLMILASALLAFGLLSAISRKEESKETFHEEFVSSKSSKSDLKSFLQEEPKELRFGMNRKMFDDPFCDPLNRDPLKKDTLLPRYTYKRVFLPDPGTASFIPTWAKIDPITGRTKEILTVDSNHYIWKPVDHY